MKFEVLTDKGQVVMTTTSALCIPDKGLIDHMIKTGYKFKIDEKIATKKKIEELLKFNIK